MCGVWISVGLGGGQAALRRMSQRGPDGSGLRSFVVAGQAVELGHRRLAIIDPDARAAQPMATADGRYWLVYNGEIYNYLELRAELEQGGWRFRTRSDSEVLLAAYASWGEACLGRLIGMFAFAVLDTTRDELFLARDPFGIKPLFWVRTAAGMAFCSALPPLLDLPGVTRRVDPQQCYDYVCHGVADAGERTLFADVRRLPAAHCWRLALGGAPPAPPRRYWQPRALPGGLGGGAAAAERIRALFLDSVRLHLRSDMPLGAALSGGIDSSAVVAAIRAIGGAGADIRTFSFVAPGSPIDESRWIALAAGAAGAHSCTVSASGAELVADLDQLIAVQAEPFGSTSIYAQYRVMRLARDHGIKVMLDGQGSDEMFAGYRPFLAARLAALLRQGRPREALALLARLRHLPGVSALAMAVQAAGMLAPDWLSPAARRLAGRPLAPSWLDAAWFRRRGVGLAAPTTRPRGAHALHEKLAESLTATILPSLLRYEDCNSMAFSIEARVPFLTVPLVEAAYSLAEEQLIDRDGTSKAIFRQAMRGLVPDPILDRSDKIGFATPEREWLGHVAPWVDAVLAAPAAHAIPGLRIDRVRARWQQVRGGRHAFDFQTWRWINLIRWTEQFEAEHA